MSPIVADLERSARFYRDVIGLDLVPAPDAGRLPWDTDPGHLEMHGLPKARLRFIGARMPGVRCGIELVEFADTERRPVRRRLQDPGSAMMILLVRDLDAVFSRLKAAGAPVVTTGGAPILVGPSKIPAVIVTDPDGHLIELAQLEPPPPATVPATGNVLGIRLRLTVPDTNAAVSYYRETLGLEPKPGAFTKDESAMAMMGLPATAEYRATTVALPGSSLLLEFMEFRGIAEARALASRVQDPGSFRLQLTVQDIDTTLTALRKAGARVISSGGAPVRMTFGGNPWRLAVAPDPYNLFLVVQQRLN